MFGTYLEGTPILCGGQYSTDDPCHQYYFLNDSWIQGDIQLQIGRYQAGAIMVGPSEWWVTNGLTHGSLTNTTEVYRAYGHFNFSMELPVR